jgi:hypothetical protein
MADISNAQVTVNSTPALLVSADQDGCIAFVHVVGNQGAYIGDSSVSTTNGLLLDKGNGVIKIEMPAGAKIYGVSATGTEVISILKQGNN